MDTAEMEALQAEGYRQGVEAARAEARAELDTFAERLQERYGDLTDRELLFLVLGWQYKANETINGMKIHAEKLLQNPMIASLMGQLD